MMFFIYPRVGNSQKASIFEEQKMIKTYPFSDPSPVPNISKRSKIFPYHKFEGYSYEGREMPWKIIRLENDYIQVFVLPEAGGKIWGAIEKSTGNEFIYRNEVMKFRNIAMRGPWTSGGIELNFGIIGHSPSTSSKVDYLVRENEDGSVSCFVGNLDLPSRTVWRVEIRLPADKAYFETRVLWYNPTSLTQSYYNWMTASAVVTDDLEFFFPGNLYLEHGGELKSWPIDAEGREISFYKNNNFGSSKSYHVVGSFEDFFGGYFHDSEFGFGHWAPYEEIPGQKLWLWALSRTGGIWEDLLTDTDGQYMEFQAGRLLNQYSPGADNNPIRQVGFSPYATDRWKEIWFPFKDINGMVDATPYGVLNVSREENGLSIGINALQNLNDTLIVRAGHNSIYKELIDMSPMEVITRKIDDLPDGDIEIIVGDRKLYYTARKDSMIINRPFEISKDLQLSEHQRMINDGVDAMNFREYDKAILIYRQLLDKDPSDREALLGLSEMYFRRGEYGKSLNFSSHALMQNTYDDQANFLAGIAYRQKSDMVNALESFGWAARSMEYRSVAYAHMAEIYIYLTSYEKAIEYAQKSLDFNRYNINAREVEIIANRLKGGETEDLIRELQKIDPLNHLSRYEAYSLDKSAIKKSNFTQYINNEFPQETYLELALFYHSLGLNKGAKEILTLGPESVKNNLWLSYLHRFDDPDHSMNLLSKCIDASPDFVFPYRLESLEMLKWAKKQRSSWKLDYYLALALGGVGRTVEASDLLLALDQQPDYWVFYLTRTNLGQGTTMGQQETDFRKALELKPDSWRTWNGIIQYYLSTKQSKLAVDFSKKAVKQFPESYTLGFLHAKALLNTGSYQQCINILTDIQILPFEGANESRKVYEEAHIRLALELIRKKRYNKSVKILQDAMEWPENIGVGKPYNPEQRKVEFLLAYCYDKLGQELLVKEHLDNIVNYTLETLDRSSPDHYLGLQALKVRGKDDEAEDLLIRINNSQCINVDLKQWMNSRYYDAVIETSTQGINMENYQLMIRIVNLYYE
jgi:tetratricopeptide (TPR) repeat protein